MTLTFLKMQTVCNMRLVWYFLYSTANWDDLYKLNV